MTNGFQGQVNAIQAPAVEGDFASANPRGTVLAGEGALVSGQGVIDGLLTPGAVAARFAWTTYGVADNDEAPGLVNTFGAGQPAGLLHRNQQGLITGWLASSSMVIPTGYQVAVFNNGDFWVKNRGGIYCRVGMKAYANFADGGAVFADTGTPSTASGSASSIAAATFTATGSIANNVLTVTNVAAGVLYPGASFTGSGVATGTKIVSQLTSTEAGGALGGKGTYTVSVPEQVVASTALAGTYGVLTVGGTVVGAFGAGMTLSGSGVVAGSTVGQQLTGTPGGAGTYVVDNNTVVSSTAITAGTNVETKWIAKSAGAVGEIIKISNIV